MCIVLPSHGPLRITSRSLPMQSKTFRLTRDLTFRPILFCVRTRSFFGHQDASERCSVNIPHGEEQSADDRPDYEPDGSEEIQPSQRANQDKKVGHFNVSSN